VWERLLLGIGNGRFSYIAEDPAYITYTLYYNIEINLQQCAQYIDYSSSGLIKSFALFHDCCCWAVLMCKTATQISISILLLFRSLLLMMQCFIYCQQSLPHCQQHFESPTFWRENSTKIKETFFKKSCYVI
jgi:hypothetical protein